jgi:hypothetical protein
MAADRDSNGRWLPGKAGGPGRPSRRREQEYLDSTIANCSVADWAEIVRKAVADAKRGDFRARAWLGTALLGKDPIGLADVLAELRAALETQGEH